MAQDGAEVGQFGRWVDATVESLHAIFGKTVDSSVLRAEVEAEYAAYTGVRITAFVPILVESRVRARLARMPNSP